VSTFDAPRTKQTAAAFGLIWFGLVVSSGVLPIDDAGVVALG